MCSEQIEAKQCINWRITKTTTCQTTVAPALAWHDGIGGHNLAEGKLIIKGVL